MELSPKNRSIMNPTRRSFLKSSAILGGSTTLGASTTGVGAKAESHIDFARLDAARKQPVLRRELFSEPVIIESIELLRDRDNFICRVRSKDGAVC